MDGISLRLLLPFETSAAILRPSSTSSQQIVSTTFKLHGHIDLHEQAILGLYGLEIYIALVKIHHVSIRSAKAAGVHSPEWRGGLF